jgi:hypothetical protein
MTKVTVRPDRSAQAGAASTPSEQIIQGVTDEFAVEDSNGRQITLKKPGILAQYRLIEMMGESAKNQVYMAMVLPILYVTAIDGAPVPPPAKKSQVEALISRLDDAGVDAVMTAINERFGAANPDEDKEALKK